MQAHCKRPANLLITHNLSPQGESQFDVSEPVHAAPNNGIARGWVVGTGQVPTEAG